MGIRQTLNRNPMLASAIAAAVIVIITAMQVRRGCAGEESDSPEGPRKAYFTVDDGETWFPHDASKVPPFKHQGKDAYRVALFRCPGGEPFVGRLERFAEPLRTRMQEAADRAAAAGNPSGAVNAATHNPEMEVKRPGDKEWVKNTPKTNDAYQAVMEVRCPDGEMTGVEALYPE